MSETRTQEDQSEQSDLVASVTELVRKADRDFERSGGSSRHWVRDCFLPTLNAGGFLVVRQVAAHLDVFCRHCNEELRLMDGQWCDRETHTICPDTVGRKHKPAQADPAGATQPEGSQAESAHNASSLSVSRETPGWPLPAPPGAPVAPETNAKTPVRCADCGRVLNDGEAKCFTVCTPCWDKVYPKVEPPAALSGPLTALVERWEHEIEGSDPMAAHIIAIQERIDDLRAVLALGVPVRPETATPTKE